MAKITTSALIDGINGKIGNVIFRGSDLGTHVYQNTSKPKAPTQAQLLVQNAVRLVRVAWSELSSEDRDSWLQLSLAVRTNRGFNGQYPRRAYGLFHDMNFWPAYAGLNLVSTAPTWPLQRSGCFAAINDVYPTFRATWTALQTGAADGLAVFMASPCTTINHRSSQLPLRIFNMQSNNVGFLNTLTGYEDIFPPLVPGQQIRIKTVSWSTIGFPYSYQDLILTAS
jgi:hypothetical protein